MVGTAESLDHNYLLHGARPQAILSVERDIQSTRPVLSTLFIDENGEADESQLAHAPAIDHQTRCGRHRWRRN